MCDLAQMHTLRVQIGQECAQPVLRLRVAVRTRRAQFCGARVDLLGEQIGRTQIFVGQFRQCLHEVPPFSMLSALTP